MLKMEKKVGKGVSAASDFEHIARLFSLYHVKHKVCGFGKGVGFVTLREKPTAETIDKLLLLEGFQSRKNFNRYCMVMTILRIVMIRKAVIQMSIAMKRDPKYWDVHYFRHK